MRPLWQADAQALLADRHLSAWSADAIARQRFASTLHHFLASQPDTEVWSIGGEAIDSVSALCRQVGMCFPLGAIEPRIHGLRGFTDALRQRGSDNFGSYSRFRYIIWHEADATLNASPELFGEIVDALTGVAAEAEYASERLMMIQRTVFVGGPALQAYADDPRGQFRSWLGRRSGVGRPFWEVVTGVEAPDVRTEAVERLIDGGVIA